MNDDIESQLRSHLHRRAAGVEAHAPVGSGLTVQQDARRRAATRHRRRMATASVATAAAVAAGLVVIARDPGTQDVSTDLTSQAASGGLAAGSATGSSTGSSSGSPQGWTVAYDDTGAATPLTDLTIQVGPEFDLIGAGNRTGSQDRGQAAADLAVAAEVKTGAPLRFVVASVQDAKRLSSGTGGTETTIAGRPARIISNRAATTITWDLSDTERVLVSAAGVDEADIAAWLSGLAKDASGRWAFSPTTTAGGLAIVPTTTPRDQASSYRSWQNLQVQPDGTCLMSGFDLSASSGGTYELWGTIADTARWSTTMPAALSVTLPGRTAPSLAFDGSYGDLTVLDGDVVLRISRWQDSESAPLPAAGLVDLLSVRSGADGAVAAGGSEMMEQCKRNAEAPAVTVAPGALDEAGLRADATMPEAPATTYDPKGANVTSTVPAVPPTDAPTTSAG